MTTRIINRLGAARERQFVGRSAEVELFRSALTAAELPFNVLYIYGPGGVGKSALLNAFARAAEQMDAGLCSLDARSFEPLPRRCWRRCDSRWVWREPNRRRMSWRRVQAHRSF